MVRVFALGTIAALFVAPPGLAARQTAAAPGPLVSTAWVQQHLTDPHLRIVATGDRGRYDHGHIPGARFVEHMDTVAGPGHRLPPPATLAAVLAKAGVTDGMHIVLYSDSPMTTGWVFSAIASTGHGDDVSMLDGSVELWRTEGRPIESTAPPAAAGTLTVRAVHDFVVDAPYVRGKLSSPDVHVLDVRTTGEWNGGHLPGATLILWQDLFADPRTQKFKSTEELRALFDKAGVKPGQQVVTYCAVGMRASLMYFVARAVGLPARVYLGSWDDWKTDTANPVAR